LAKNREATFGYLAARDSEVRRKFENKVKKRLVAAASGITDSEATELAFFYTGIGPAGKAVSPVAFVEQLWSVFDYLRVHAHATPPLYYWIVDYHKESSIVHCQGDSDQHGADQVLDLDGNSDLFPRILSSRAMMEVLPIHEMAWVLEAAFSHLVSRTPGWDERAKAELSVSTSRLHEFDEVLESYWTHRVLNNPVDDYAAEMKQVVRAISESLGLDEGTTASIVRSIDERLAQSKLRSS